MSPWVTLALLAPFFSASALSPISQFVEPEALITEATRDPTYRLPTTTSPRHYIISITPYFENENDTLAFTFDGTALIYLTALEANLTEIIMHCNDLTIDSLSVTTIVNGVSSNVATNGVIPICDAVYDFMRIGFNNELIQGQEYHVSLSYRGNLQNDMRGFYRSWYIDSTGQKRWMGTTQFQPGHARKAFPCYDEPGFKATFDITIVRENSFGPSIGNMPISTTATVLARDNVGITGAWAYETGVRLLEYMDQYTDIPYYEVDPNMDMKQVAIPDFSAGAMENWGLLTYREALILYDPENSNNFYRQRVPNIVAHEIAHMWFGNLVTCDWWDVLWLNEGFARYYQYFLTGAVLPELGWEGRFILEQLHTSMLSDSVDSAHALTNPDVNTPTEVSAHFSTITYARGASVIRMTEHLIGYDTFLKALRNYLKSRKYDMASPEHLFEAFDAAAAEDQALASYPGFTVEEYFRTWADKAGHPVVTVVVNHQTGRMTVTQARWERDTGVAANPSLWHIPITWTSQGDIDFVTTKPREIISEQVTVLDRGTSGYEWVLFNTQQTGFYRVNYDLTTWGLITLALRSNERNTIHEYNRAQIVDDVFQFARAGTMSYTRALNILSFLEFETDYAPWIAAITGFNWLRRRFAHDEMAYAELNRKIVDFSTALVIRLGFSDLPTDTFLDGLLRMELMSFLCNVGHEQCNAAAVSYFQALRATPSTPVPPNMRPWVYCGGLRHGNADDFNFLWNRYVNETLAGERVVLLQNLGCTSAESLNFYMSEIVSSGDNVRSQDYSSALSSAVSGNEANTLIMFQWIQNNYQAIIEELGSLSTPLSYVSARLLTITDIQEFEAWCNANPTLAGVATGLSGAAATRQNLIWSAERMPQLTEYFENGYQEFEIIDEVDPEPEESEEEVEPEPEEETEEEPQPGSGNKFTVTALTLLASFCASVLT